MFDRASQIERRFRRIAASLQPFELQRLEEDPPLSERELFGELFGQARSNRFLGFYSHGGIMRALEIYGILELLKERGFPDVKLDLELTDTCHHRLRVYFGPEPNPDTVLIDFAAHLTVSADLRLGDDPTPMQLLVIDWLMLQNPRARFGPFDQLPGQRYPGLGIGLEIGALISRIAYRLKLDGCMAIPAWYHNAVIYSQRYVFVEPTVEGRFQAIQRDTSGLTTAEVSWGFELGCVREVTLTPGPRQRRIEGPVHWHGRPQVWPLTPSLEAYFQTPRFLGIRDAMRDSFHCEIDMGKLRRLRGEDWPPPPLLKPGR